MPGLAVSFSRLTQGGANAVVKYEAEEIYAQAAEAMGGELVEFTQGGETLTFPHPALQSDEWLAGLAEVEGGAEANVRYLLGDEQYDRFIKLGGKPFAVMFILNDVNKRSADAMADGTPTRSGTSSQATRRPSKRR